MIYKTVYVGIFLIYASEVEATREHWIVLSKHASKGEIAVIARGVDCESLRQLSNHHRS
jgi:hypothetical protein